MIRAARRPPFARGAVVLGTALCVLAGCSSTAPGAGANRSNPSDSTAPASVPLQSTFSAGSGDMAVVAMGHLDDPLETFWQLFVRSGVDSPWVLATPAGVADNGGLVASANSDTTPSGPTMVLAGFEPSQDLTFSPLASSTDRGGTWSPGILPEALAAVPDVLSTSSGGGSVALARAGGGDVLRSAGNVSTWSLIESRGALASSTAGRSCGVGALTAVTVDVTGVVEVGTTCSAPGVVGIFGRVGGSWRLLGPRLSGASASSPTQVARLVEVDGVSAALVVVQGRSGAGVMSLSRSVGGSWSTSAVVPMRRGDRIASTGVEPGGGFVVLFSGPRGSSVLDTETGPAGAWQQLPAPPPASAAVAVGAGGAVDALTVASTVLTDWRLGASTRTWSKIDTVTVPIQFGSSS